MFSLNSPFQPNLEQENAIKKLSENIGKGVDFQTLLGVTGSGKTFTVANVIQKLNIPTLVLCHNKTLAGQLYQEFKEFFPSNAVSYFVSYYDFYQPEAYIPSSDTYIEKTAEINETIDKLRLATMSNLMSRNDVVTVASVSCIYGIGSPVDFKSFSISLNVGQKITTEQIIKSLVDMQYLRSEFDFKRGTFRIRANALDIYVAYDDLGIRLVVDEGTLKEISIFDTLSGETRSRSEQIIIYPAKQYLVSSEIFAKVEKEIRADLEKEYLVLKSKQKLFEAERLLKRVNFDLEMIKEMGYVSGIENYSRYFDDRKVGEPPNTLLEYYQYRYGDNWLLVVDESHMTIPQVRGMFAGDFSRKNTLIEYGFRLSSAFDNRPLKFEEFEEKVKKAIFVSATPSPWELEKSSNKITELLVRPTGIIDPKITIKKMENAISDILNEIKARAKNNERVLLTTLTKRTAEDLSKYLIENGVNAAYLHSDIQTLERGEILNKLRRSEYDVLIGINLLREGLDLPEVSLVCILDADKEGFLRGRTSLIQTMGRAARHISGEVILYADNITKSMNEAIDEVTRRRKYQQKYNEIHHITPISIKKEIRNSMIEEKQSDVEKLFLPKGQNDLERLIKVDNNTLTQIDRKRIIKKLEKEMVARASDMDFEAAILLRDKIREMES